MNINEIAQSIFFASAGPVHTVVTLQWVAAFGLYPQGLEAYTETSNSREATLPRGMKKTAMVASSH